MIRRCKNYTVAVHRYFYYYNFFSLACWSSGSCVYMATSVKDCMRQQAVQQHCMSIGCIWCFCHRIRAHGRVWIQTSPTISGFLSYSLRSHTGLCGQLWCCSGSRSSFFGQGKRSPLSHSWAASMSRAGWVWASRDKERTPCSPAPNLLFMQELRNEGKHDLGIICSPDLRPFWYGKLLNWLHFPLATVRLAAAKEPPE